jgi:hypothetical protein
VRKEKEERGRGEKMVNVALLGERAWRDKDTSLER